MSELEEYLEYLRSRNRTDRTLENKRKVLKAILGYLKDHGRHYSAYDIDADDVRYYLNTAKVKEGTKKVYTRDLGLFIKYHTGTDVVQDMHLLWNRTEHSRLFISKEDMIKVYKVAEPRARLVIVLGAFMGLRTIEMERMKWTDITLDHITIRGKGHNTGLIMDQPMSEIVFEELMEYKTWFTKLVTDKGYQDMTGGHVFFVYDKANKVLNPMTEGNLRINKLVVRAGKKADVNITPHSLRRLYATTLYYEHKLDAVTLRTLMRHASITTTYNNYIAPFDAKKREITNVLDNSMKGAFKELRYV